MPTSNLIDVLIHTLSSSASRLLRLLLYNISQHHIPPMHIRRLSLASPLRTLREGSAERTGPATEELRPFSRAVLVVEYEEGGVLVQQVTAAMDQINSRALVNVQGSLRAYVLTPEVKLLLFTIRDHIRRVPVVKGPGVGLVSSVCFISLLTTWQSGSVS